MKRWHWQMAVRKVCFLIAVLVGFTACEKEEQEDGPGMQPQLISFKLEKKNNPQLKEDVIGIIDVLKREIDVIIDYPVEDEWFIPTVEVTSGALITPGSLEKINASTVVYYVISQENYILKYRLNMYINAPIQLKGLVVDGIPCIYCKKENTFYCASGLEDLSGEKVIDYNGVAIGQLKVEGILVEKGKPTALPAIEFGKKYEVVASNASQFVSTVLIFTGLPIVAIYADYTVGQVKKETESACHISVLDPAEGGNRVLLSQYSTIHLRGNTSLWKDKKSYSLEFQDPVTGEEADKSVFGLRKDGDWILDAMATDRARMRNRLCTDIWLDVARLSYNGQEPKAVAATRGRMVELFFNDEYRGVYCFTEKVDRKQLKLSKENGCLYKAEGWDPEVRFERYYTLNFDNNRETWGDYEQEGWEIKYPKPAYDWKPLVDFVGFAVDSDDELFRQTVDSRLDLDNMIDFLLFVNMIGGTDNTAKNAFFASYNQNGDVTGRRFFYVPWDLDATLGRQWMENEVSSEQFLGLRTTDDTPSNNLFKRLVKLNPEQFNDRLKRRWTDLRQGVYSMTDLEKRFDYYRDILVNSGAYEREKKRWATADVNDEVRYMKDWLKRHLEFLDRYISAWEINNGGL